jgi:hypothetical protein
MEERLRGSAIRRRRRVHEPRDGGADGRADRHRAGASARHMFECLAPASAGGS